MSTKPWIGRTAPLRFRHHVDDASKQGISPDFVRLENKTARRIDGATRHAITRLFFHGSYSPVITDSSIDDAVRDHCIDRGLFTGPYAQA